MHSSDVSEPALLDIRGFTRKYNCSRSTLYKLMGTGEVPAVKVGRRTYIPAAAAHAWAESLKPYTGTAPQPADELPASQQGDGR